MQAWRQTLQTESIQMSSYARENLRSMKMDLKGQHDEENVRYSQPCSKMPFYFIPNLSLKTLEVLGI